MSCAPPAHDEPLPSRDESYDPALDRMNREVAKLLGWSVERRTVNDEQPRMVYLPERVAA